MRVSVAFYRGGDVRSSEPLLNTLARTFTGTYALRAGLRRPVDGKPGVSVWRATVFKAVFAHELTHIT